MDFDILYFLQHLHSGWLNKIMLLVTELGEGARIWIAVSISLLFYKKTRKCGILMIISLLLCGFVGEDTLKPLIARMRPCNRDLTVGMLLPRPRDFSCPSGHTSTSLASAVMIWLFDKKYGKLALGWAAVIAFSRMYLFVHFPTDILAGALLGTMIALTVYYVEINVEKLIMGKLKTAKQ